MIIRLTLVLTLLPLTLFGQGKDFLEVALMHYSRGEFEEARQYLEKEVRARPKSFQSHFLLGATLVQLNDTTAAIRQLRKAHELNPAHADARKLLATQYLDSRQPREAVALLEPVVNNVPYDEETHLLIINARQTAGDSSGSFALAREAARRFPRSSQVAAWLGFQLQFSGMYEESKSYLLKAIELDPTFAVSYQLLGDVFLKEEKYSDAVLWFRRALERMPGDIETLVGLSRALAETGEVVQAVELLVNAARIAPQDARVRLQLSRLYFRMGDEPAARREAELSVTLRDSGPAVAGPPAGLRVRR